MLRLSKEADYALMAMKHLASDPERRAGTASDPLARIRDWIAAVLAECSILEIVADPEPSVPPVSVMSLPAMRRVSAL
jgi:hypothetical protein